MIKEREIPTLTKKLISEYDDTTGKLLSKTIQIHIPTLNEEAATLYKWTVRHFEGEYVFVHADNPQEAALIATETMVWDIVKVLLTLKSNKGEFYDSDGDRLLYNFRSKEFYLAED